MVMPLEMAITRQGGGVETVRLPVEMWNQGPRFVHAITGGGRVTRVMVDPRHALTDTRRANNRWPRR